MLDRYDLFACIDFDTDTFAISVPLLRRRDSNYLYIPKTDNQFLVLDFYEVQELGYSLRYIDINDQRPVLIGEKVPVPIVQQDAVYVVEPTWSEGEIRSRYPRLDNEAVKAFLSLRSRLSAAPSFHADINAAMDDLLSDPVRSRYWISRISALVRSAYEQGDPPPDFLERAEKARMSWLDRFAAKSTIKLVQKLLEVPHLQLRPALINKVMLHRFESLLLTKGLFVSREELRAYERMFPEGIFAAIRQEAVGEYDYWRRRKAVSEYVARQALDLLPPRDGPGGRSNDPRLWSLSELSSLQLFFEVVAGNDTGLDDARHYFLPLFNTCLDQIQLFLGDRYRLSGIVFRTREPPPWFMSEAIDALRLPDNRFPSSPEEWVDALRRVMELHRKLVVLSKIVRPGTGKLKDFDIPFEGIDYVLLMAVHKVVTTKNISALRTVLSPTPSSVT